jgi:hypothetical protein
VLDDAERAPGLGDLRGSNRGHRAPLWLFACGVCPESTAGPAGRGRDS